jgi:predicted DNA-binding transcriptional regulator AlpA
MICSQSQTAQHTDAPPRYFNTKQAAAYLGLSTQFMEIARHKGGGPQYIKLAKAVRYRVEDLDDWMASHTQRHTAEGADNA